MPVQSFASIFAAADGPGRILLMEVVEPWTVHGYFSTIPAEVVVIGHDIAYVYNLVIYIAHCKHGHGSEPCLVHTVAEIVEDPVVLQ